MNTIDTERAASAAERASPAGGRMAVAPITVNGVTISRKAIAAEIQNFPGRSPVESLRAATQALVVRELLLQEARRLEIPVDQHEDDEGRRETFEDALLRALIEREIVVPCADDASLRRFYENNRRRFTTPALFEARHILIAARRDDAAAYAAARQKALSIAETLAAAPQRFGELARAVSACPSAALDGSLGQIAPGDTTPEFEAALVRLAPGEISGPVETRYGVHLIRLDRRIEGRQLPFEAVRESIAAYLDENVRRRAVAQYVELLIGRADISGIVLNGATTPLVQ